MQTIDERFKDASPKETVVRIQKILEQHGIEVIPSETETGIANCYSLQLLVKDSKMLTNGKGINKDLAYASAYGEFMERLQSGFLMWKTLPINDAQFFNREQLEEHCGPWLREFLHDAVENEGLPVTYEKLFQACFDAGDDPEKVEVMPLYNAMSGEMTWFPLHIAKNICSTNGLAAGNSVEEATVQAFSEIIERNYERKFFSGQEIPPDIPESYLAQYATAYETICDIRSHGFDVSVKDCSLGKGFPMLAVVVVDRATHQYRVHVGACPVFEIALERCLTEMFQNRYVSQVFTENTLFRSSGSRSFSDKMRLFVRGEGTFPVEFFTGKPTYSFVPYEDLSEKTNAELVQWIVAFLKKQGKTLLIRDCSHLGFTTIRLYVPGMSGIFYSDYADALPLTHLRRTAEKCCPDLGSATMDQLYELMLLSRYKLSNFHTTRRTSKLSYTGLFDSVGMNLPAKMNQAYGALSLAYIEWACGNRNVASYVASAVGGMEGEDEAYLSCLHHVLTRETKTYSEEQYLQMISFLYKPQIIEAVREGLQAGKNPFRRFLICCKEENCQSCVFAPYCSKKKMNEVYNIVAQCSMAYDNAAAFEKIKNMIKAG